jgi:tetratricopeptide (TPR) repeat protein
MVMARTRRSRPDRRGRKAIDWRSSRKIVFRVGTVLLLGLLLVTVTLRSSIAEVFKFTHPARALAWQPTHAAAAANLSHRLLAAGRAADGRRLARRALERDLVDARAYSALALAADLTGDTRRATEFMHLAHAMSRRDRVASVWLIRQAIQAGNFDAAINHFDMAMRTSSRGAEALMPILIAATADPRFVHSLGPVLASDPEWKTPFLLVLANSGPNPEHIVRLSRGRLDPVRPDQRAVLSRLVQRLIAEQRHDLAWSIYREARPGTLDQAATRLRDPEYEAGNGFPPFDWQLADQPDLTALREARRDGRPGFALALAAEGGRTGEVARQVVRLQPGDYTLQFDAGAIPAGLLDRPLINLSCTPGDIAIYQVRPSQAGAGPQRMRGSFTVPRACRWQALSISIASNETPSELPWIANIVIRPVR